MGKGVGAETLKETHRVRLNCTPGEVLLRGRNRSHGLGVPAVVKWKRIRLVSMMVWVRSLALISGLRIQCCCELWCSSQMRLGSGVECGCGVGQQLQLQFDPEAGNFHMPPVQP